MPKISLNPLVCPECGAGSTRVRGSYYTEKQEIVRARRCQACEHTFYTIQECEVAIDEGTFAVRFPSFGSQRHSRKIVKIERF